MLAGVKPQCCSYRPIPHKAARGRGTVQSGTPGAVTFDVRIGTAAETAGRLARPAGACLAS